MGQARSGTELTAHSFMKATAPRRRPAWSCSSSNTRPQVLHRHGRSACDRARREGEQLANPKTGERLQEDRREEINELLGEEAESMTDQAIVQVRRHAETMAQIVVERYQDRCRIPE